MGQSITGAIGGLFANQREGSRDAGNVFANDQNTTDTLRNRSLAAINTNSTAKDVMSNPLYSGLFGQNGTMHQQENLLNQYQNQGFNLTPEDHTAYGQVSGDITRQFGQSEQGLAQALSSRGLSNSGVAGAAFSGSQGSKLEQLAKAQQQIAQQRFQSNLQRIGQTQQFLGQLGAQAQGAMGQQIGVETGNRDSAMEFLHAQQNQSNEDLKQQEGTAHATQLSNTINGYNAGQAADTQAATKAVGMFGGKAEAGTGTPAVQNGTYDDRIVNAYGSYRG